MMSTPTLCQKEAQRWPHGDRVNRKGKEGGNRQREKARGKRRKGADPREGGGKLREGQPQSPAGRKKRGRRAGGGAKPPKGRADRERRRGWAGRGGEGEGGGRPEGRGARFVMGERTLEPTTSSGLAHDVPNERETANQPGPLALLGTRPRPKVPRSCRKQLSFSFPCPCPVRGHGGLTP